MSAVVLMALTISTTSTSASPQSPAEITASEFELSRPYPCKLNSHLVPRPRCIDAFKTEENVPYAPCFVYNVNKCLLHPT